MTTTTSTKPKPELDPKKRNQGYKMRFEDHYPKRTDGLCRCGCGERLPSGRRQWASDKCSNKCVEAFQILKGDGNAIRRAVFRRDKGICACCGMDTEKERKACMDAGWKWHRQPKGWTPPTDQELDEIEQRRRKYMRLGFPSPSLKSWWQADHIQEVVNGGGACTIDNLQTLCIVCHNRKTAELAAARATARKAHKYRGNRELFGLAQFCANPGSVEKVCDTPRGDASTLTSQQPPQPQP